MKIDLFQYKYHWNLFSRTQLTICQHWFRKWLGTEQVTSHFLNRLWAYCWPSLLTHTQDLNSLTPGKLEWNFRHFQIDFSDWWLKHLLWNCSTIISLDFTDGQSTLVQVMAWCHQATSHYLSQCWPRSLSPYGATRPQWVNTLRSVQNGKHSAENISKLIFCSKTNIVLLIK